MTTPREQLAHIVKEHRRNKAIRFGTAYACICGKILTSNSHHRQAEHIADAIIQAGWTPPPTEAHNTTTEN